MEKKSVNLAHDMFDLLMWLGVLDGGDLESEEDLFDAVGFMLLEIDTSKDENDIREICTQLHNLLTK